MLLFLLAFAVEVVTPPRWGWWPRSLTLNSSRVTRGSNDAVTRRTDPAHLPALLQRYGLDPAVRRIEIEEDTLEKVVLRLITVRETEAEEATDAHRA
jgi:hypothetical protein